MSILLSDVRYVPDRRGEAAMAAQGQAIIDRLDDRIEEQDSHIRELEARVRQYGIERGIMTSVALALAEQLAGNPTAQALLDRARARVIGDVRARTNVAGTRRDFATIFAKNLTVSDWKDETRRLIDWLAVDSETAGQLPRELPTQDSHGFGR